MITGLDPRGIVISRIIYFSTRPLGSGAPTTALGLNNSPGIYLVAREGDNLTDAKEVNKRNEP